MALAVAGFPPGAVALGQGLRNGAAALASQAIGQPVAVAAGLGLAGLVLLVLGVRWPRVAGALGGAAAGALAALGWFGALGGAALEPGDHWKVAGAAAVLLVAGGLWPRTAALAFGLLAGVAAGSAVAAGPDRPTGTALGALACGLAAWFLWRRVLAALASLLGAALLGGAALALLPVALAREAANRPALLLAWLATGLVVGLAFQAGAAPAGRGKKVSPEDRPADPGARSPGSRS